MTVRGAASIALWLAGLLQPLATSASASVPDPIVTTAEGPVRGTAEDGIRKFLGIPYAAPPIGPRRWRPPEAPARRRGLLQATAFGPACPQVTGLGVFAGPASVTEDCLYLNVFAPVGGRPKPVLVWLHGGGHMAGASNDYDGSKLASGGPLGVPTVVVTINSRLGLLGFLAHPALDGEGHAADNYGLMDVQQALRWVKANIAAFGGDPNRVTVGGQSSGGGLAGALMLSPSNAGLFQGVIAESAPLSILPSRSLALGKGEKFAIAAGCDGAPAAIARCLRDLPVPQILQLQGSVNGPGPYLVGPMVDGTLVPQPPMAAWASGQFVRVPVMGGTVHDEGQFAIVINAYAKGGGAMTTDQVSAAIRTAYAGGDFPPGTGDRVLARYPVTPDASPALAYGASLTGPLVCRPNKAMTAMARWVPVYAYEFQDAAAPFYFPPLKGVRPLAAHTIDLQFLFPRWHGGVLGINHRPQDAASPGEIEGAEAQLSDRMVAFWTRFVATGDPNRAGDATWPAYNQSHAYLAEAVGALHMISEAQFRADHECDFWDTILAY